MTKKKLIALTDADFIHQNGCSVNLTLFPKLIQKFGLVTALVFSKFFDFTKTYEQILSSKENKTKSPFDLVMLTNNEFIKDHPIFKKGEISPNSIYLSEVNPAQAHFYHSDGRLWICMSYNELARLFWSAFSSKTIQRSINLLHKEGLILKEKNIINHLSNALAFSIDFKKLQAFLHEDQPLKSFE